MRSPEQKRLSFYARFCIDIEDRALGCFSEQGSALSFANRSRFRFMRDLPTIGFREKE